MKVPFALVVLTFVLVGGKGAPAVPGVIEERDVPKAGTFIGLSVCGGGGGGGAYRGTCPSK